MVIAIAVENLEGLQLDVQTTFLNENIERETYVAATAGFETTGGAQQVMKLLKRLADEYTERCENRAWRK